MSPADEVDPVDPVEVDESAPVGAEARREQWRLTPETGRDSIARRIRVYGS